MESHVRKPARIVVVDDNPADVFLIEEALRANGVGFEITRFEDGEKALIALCHEGESAGAPAPDLILLDLKLPRAEGIEVLAKIRQTARLARVPVAILTSSQSPKDKQEAAAFGAARFVPKPTDLDSFLETVGRAAKELLGS
jgi:CheY-like chemotaxis protein